MRKEWMIILPEAKTRNSERGTLKKRTKPFCMCVQTNTEQKEKINVS